MRRLEAFRGLEKHAFYGRDFKRLKVTENIQCQAFIIENEHLKHLEFEQAVQRWLVDRPRPKNYPLMCDLLLAANTTRG